MSDGTCPLLAPDTPLREAVLRICVAGPGHGIVVDGDRPAGLVTHRELERALAGGRSPDDAVADIMNRNLRQLPASAFPEERPPVHPGDPQAVVTDAAGHPLAPTRHYRRQIPVLQPVLGDAELAAVAECMRSGWISSQGPFVRELERQFADHTRQPEALAVSNGTVALHLALVALGIGPGDEVIVPDLTFASPVNSVIQTGATPVPVDLDPATWTLSPEQAALRIGKRTRALIAVHLYGHACDMDALGALAREHGLLVIEDCAEALGTRYRGAPVGGFGDAATFSFFANKTITTGEGGMVALRSREVAKRARILRDHGMSPQRRYWHEVIGFNYRLTNLQAAIGVAQMRRLDELLARKRAIAAHYHRALREFPALRPPPEAEWCSNSFWLYTLLLGGDSPVSRDRLAEGLARNGIDTRPAFPPIHCMPPYREYARGREFPVADRLAERGLCLPSSADLTEEEAEYVVECLAMQLACGRIAQRAGLAE